MSVCDYGIPLPLGQALRPTGYTTCPILCTAGPDYFTFIQNTNGLLQINSIKNDEADLVKAENPVNEELFAVCKSNQAITSNISLANVMDGSCGIQNAEFNLYATINGVIDLNTIRFGTDTFYSNFYTIWRYWEWKIPKYLDMEIINLNLYDVIYNTLISILQKTYDSFIYLSKTYISFDLSVCSNIILSCYASMATVIINYLKTGILNTSLDIDSKLKIVDPIFYNIYKNDINILQYTNTMIDEIFKILSDINNEESFISTIIRKNNTIKVTLGNAYALEDTNNYICGKIGAAVSLSFLLECMRYVGSNTSTGLVLLMALPQKFLYV